MPEKLTQEEVWRLIQLRGDEEFELDRFRSTHGISPDNSVFYTTIHRLVAQKKIKKLGRARYQIVLSVEPVQVYGISRERRPPFPLIFPRDFNTGMEFDFAQYVVVREGDLITVGGVKSQGKTHLALNFCGENIDLHPVLMGNEYTKLVKGLYVPVDRFLNRLDTMSVTNSEEGGQIQWVDENGKDKFTLLPIHENHAEHVVENRLNIIDWIDIDAGRLYDIGKVLRGVKNNLGRGVGVAFLQKGEGATDPRGKQFVRDYSDLEIILDNFGKLQGDVLLTIRGAKETTSPIVGKTYAYTIGGNGTKTFNFREVRRCPSCRGLGYVKGEECDKCFGHKYVDA